VLFYAIGHALGVVPRRSMQTVLGPDAQSVRPQSVIGASAAAAPRHISRLCAKIGRKYAGRLVNVTGRQKEASIHMSADSPVDLDLATIASRGDALLSALNAIREITPIFGSDLSNCWIVTRH